MIYHPIIIPYQHTSLTLWSPHKAIPYWSSLLHGICPIISHYIPLFDDITIKYTIHEPIQNKLLNPCLKKKKKHTRMKQQFLKANLLKTHIRNPLFPIKNHYPLVI